MGVRSFAGFLLGRVAASAGVVLAVSAANFLLIRVLYPEAFAFEAHGPLREALDYHWRAVVHLDLGTTNRFPRGEPIAALVAEGLPADAALFFGALAVGLLFGIAGGSVCALRPRKPEARVLEVLAALALCAPVYWVGLILLVLAPQVTDVIGVDLLTPGTYQPLTEDPGSWLRSLIVPWLIAGAPLAAICLRMTTTVVRETAGEDYVRTAVAKGLSQVAVARRHALRPALGPVATSAGTYAPLLVGNVVLVEQVFNVPGVFRLIPGAISNGDFALLQALVLVGAVLVVSASLAVDLLVARLDPRVLLRTQPR